MALTFDRIFVSKMLKAAATFTCGTLAGGCFYISSTEAPARMKLDMPSALRNWNASYNRAVAIQVWYNRNY